VYFVFLSDGWAAQAPQSPR